MTQDQDIPNCCGAGETPCSSTCSAGLWTALEANPDVQIIEAPFPARPIVPITIARHHEEVTVNVPGATSEELRTWALAVERLNPISRDNLGRWPTCGINVTDEPFMGVELTLAAAGRPLLTLTLFGDRPNDEERKIMEEHNDGTAGL